ncbi:MAG: ATP-binding protein, partial [Chitinispirillia bacterium]
MFNIPILSTDNKLNKEVCGQVSKTEGTKVYPVVLKTTQQYIEFMNVEMPELVFLNFSDIHFKAFDLLNTIIQDPWLLHGGIIGLCGNDEEVSKIEIIRGTNIIVVIKKEELEENLSKIVSIVIKNRRIIFQREIGTDIVRNISGSFKLENDILEAKCYVNLICNFLFNSNKLSAKKKFKLQLALIELLTNAIEHGNCQIDYDEKSEWLEKHRSTEGLIQLRNSDPEIAQKRVLFEYTITPTSAKFFIADEGKGFSWREVKDVTKLENLLELHGRGILMTKSAVDSLTYNEKGNEVTFEIKYEAGESEITPGLFDNMKSKSIKKGIIIFQQDEPSNYLYYIVKGKYSVIVNNKQVSTLTSDDIFM